MTDRTHTRTRTHTYAHAHAHAHTHRQTNTHTRTHTHKTQKQDTDTDTDTDTHTQTHTHTDHYYFYTCHTFFFRLNRTCRLLLWVCSEHPWLSVCIWPWFSQMKWRNAGEVSLKCMLLELWRIINHCESNEQRLDGCKTSSRSTGMNMKWNLTLLSSNNVCFVSVMWCEEPAVCNSGTVKH